MDRLVLLCVGSAVLTYLLAHLYRIAAIALHIVDQPNHRSAHEDVVPTGSGVSFILVFCLALMLIIQAEWGAPSLIFQLLPPLLLVAVVGFVDDLKPVPWWIRAPIHVLSAGWIILMVGFPTLNVLGHNFELGLAGSLFGVAALVWLLNLYNFMDGIDGIAMGEAVFVLAAASILAVFTTAENINQPILVLLSCCVGFLVINWPKARVFMGDAGSGFLGLMFGILILAETLIPLWAWLILLGWFITDACLTIAIRLIRGEKIHEAHNVHAYQHLNRAVGTRNTLFVILGINLIWLCPIALAATIAQDWGGLLLILAFLPILVFQFYCGAGQLTPRLMTLRQPA